MKQLFLIVAVLTVLVTGCTKETKQFQTAEQQALSSKLVGNTDGEIVEGTLLVKLENGCLDIPESIPTTMRSVFPRLPKNEEAARKYGLNKWYILEFSEDIRPETMAEMIASKKEVDLLDICLTLPRTTRRKSKFCPMLVILESFILSMEPRIKIVELL